MARKTSSKDKTPGLPDTVEDAVILPEHEDAPVEKTPPVTDPMLDDTPAPLDDTLPGDLTQVAADTPSADTPSVDTPSVDIPSVDIPSEDIPSEDTAVAVEHGISETATTGDTQDVETQTPPETADAAPVASEIEAEARDDQTKSNVDTAPAPERAADTRGAAPAPAPVAARGGGFLPLLLGGVVAGGIGFGVSHYDLSQGWPLVPRLGTGVNEADITALEGRIGALDSKASQAASDISELAAAQAAVQAAMSDSPPETAPDDALVGQINGLTDRLVALQGSIGALQDRLEVLEARPAVVSAPDMSSELAALRTAMAAQAAEVQALQDAAAAQDRALTQSAQGAMARAALSLVQTGLDSGAPLGAALTDLSDAGVTVPDALTTLADGAPTLAALQAEFPALAREALAAARQATPGATGGMGSFLRGQLGIRSLEPRAGDDPDAVLSRAEAAMRDGRLADAIAEVESLPEAARVPLTGWAARAAQRQAAVSATEILRQSLTAN